MRCHARVIVVGLAIVCVVAPLGAQTKKSSAVCKDGTTSSVTARGACRATAAWIPSRRRPRRSWRKAAKADAKAVKAKASQDLKKPPRRPRWRKRPTTKRPRPRRRRRTIRSARRRSARTARSRMPGWTGGVRATRRRGEDPEARLVAGGHRRAGLAAREPTKTRRAVPRGAAESRVGAALNGCPEPS